MRRWGRLRWIGKRFANPIVEQLRFAEGGAWMANGAGGEPLGGMADVMPFRPLLDVREEA